MERKRNMGDQGLLGCGVQRIQTPDSASLELYNPACWLIPCQFWCNSTKGKLFKSLFKMFWHIALPTVFLYRLQPTHVAFVGRSASSLCICHCLMWGRFLMWLKVHPLCDVSFSTMWLWDSAWSHHGTSLMRLSFYIYMTSLPKRMAVENKSTYI